MMLPNVQHTMTRTALALILLVFLLTAFFINPDPIQAIGNPDGNLPSFADFRWAVQNGDPTVLRGVYVPDVLALPIVQQPLGSPWYVSNKDDQVTQFSMASQLGNVGLLAHNTLSGKYFSQLGVGQEVRLIYGDGRVEYSVIKSIRRFYALDPRSPFSDFQDLETDVTVSAEELFNQVYRGERHVTFQTCISANFNASWGRLFVIAEPTQMSALGNRRDAFP